MWTPKYVRIPSIGQFMGLSRELGTSHLNWLFSPMSFLGSHLDPL